MHPGSHVLWGCSAPPAILPPSLKLRQNGRETEKLQGPSQASTVGGDKSHVVFGKKNSLVKRKCEMAHCHDAAASSFVTKVWGWSLSTFSCSCFKRHINMWNWLVGLPGQILYEQSPRCQRKWWACSWLCSSPISPFSVLVSLDDRLCGLVVRVLGYRFGGPGFDTQALQELPTKKKKKKKKRKTSSGSGTGFTQPREYNWGATW
jgi:hypothetical protein